MMKWSVILRPALPMALLVSTPIEAQGAGGPLEERAARPWYTPEIEAFLASDRANLPPRCSILFTGSSSVRLWDSLANDMAPAQVINRGFGGSPIADVDDNFDRIVSPYRPKAIFFYAGENDLSSGKPAVQVFADFRRFMALKSKTLGDTPVYFISLKPSKLRFDQMDRQSEVNALVKHFSRQRRDLHFIDVVAAMLDKGQLRDIYREDGLHMTRDGYAIWTQLIRPAVLAESSRRTSRCPKR
jgi:lysophospholipase L1-like esterase